MNDVHPMLQGAIDAINPVKNAEIVANATEKANADIKRADAITSFVDSLIEDAREFLEECRDAEIISEWILENRFEQIAEWMWNDEQADEIWPALMVKNTSIQDLHEVEEGTKKLSEVINQELVLYFTTELEPIKARAEYILSVEDIEPEHIEREQEHLRSR